MWSSFDIEFYLYVKNKCVQIIRAHKIISKSNKLLQYLPFFIIESVKMLAWLCGLGLELLKVLFSF